MNRAGSCFQIALMTSVSTVLFLKNNIKIWLQSHIKGLLYVGVEQGALANSPLSQPRRLFTQHADSQNEAQKWVTEVLLLKPELEDRQRPSSLVQYSITSLDKHPLYSLQIQLMSSQRRGWTEFLSILLGSLATSKSYTYKDRFTRENSHSNFIDSILT